MHISFRATRLLIPAAILFFAVGVVAQSAPTQSSAKPAQGATKPATPPPPEGQVIAGGAKPAAPPPPDAGANLPATTPILTLNGLCSGGPQPTGPNCKTVITKGEFERLVLAGSTQTTVPPQLRTRVLQQFAQAVVMDKTADARGLDKDPDVQAFLEASRMQVLMRAFNNKLVQQAQQVTPEQIDQYYQKNHGEFDEAKTKRLFIPKVSAAANIDAAKAREIAEKLQKDAAAGKDMDALEKQAYTELGLPAQQAPSTEMGVRRRRQFSEDQAEAVFKLEAGQVTPVLEDQNGLYVFKAESKNTVPLDQVRTEIKNDIARQNFDEEVKKIFDPVQATLDPDYFNGQKTLEWQAGRDSEQEREQQPRRQPAPRGAAPTRPPQ